MALKVQTVTVVDDDRKILNVLTYNGYTPADAAVNITAGNGLTGGGTLATTRTLAVGQGDGITVGPTTVGVDTSVARTTTAINPGNGLTGGGTLATTRTLAVGQGDGIAVGPTTVGVDASVARTTTSINPGNGLTGGGTLATTRTLTVGQGDGITVGPTTVGVDSTVARTTTSINPGNGLTGGGTLATTRTLAVGQGDGITVVPGSVSVKPGSGIVSNSTGVHVSAGNGLSANSSFLTVGQGDGITVGPTTVGVDSTVARTTTAITTGNGLTGGGTLATTRTLAVGQGDGITVGPTTVGVDSSVIRNVGTQIIAGIKSFTTLIESFATAGLWGAKVKAGLQVSNVSSLTGASWIWQARNATDDIVAGVQVLDVGNQVRLYTSNTEYVSFTGALVDDAHLSDNIVKTTGLQTITGSKTFSSPIGGSITGTAPKLTTSRSFTVGSTAKSFDGSANVAWTLAEIGAAPAAGSASITTVGTIASGVWNAGTITSSDTVRGATGSAVWPTFSFDADKDTGIYSAGLGSIGFATNGIRAATISSTGLLKLFNTAGTHGTEVIAQPTANRTLTLPDDNVTLVSGTMVPTTVDIIAGNGLSGGGTLAANRTLTVGQGDGISVAADSVAVDSTVVRISGNQSISGFKSFGSPILQAGGSAAAPAFTFSADTNSGMYSAGADSIGFSTGGNIAALITSTGNLRLYNTAGTIYTEISNQPTANRVLTLPDGSVTLVTGTMVPTSTSILDGDGITGGGNLSATRTLSVDTTVVRTTGNQTIAGTKTFTSAIGHPIAPTASSHVANKIYVDSEVGDLATRSITWNAVGSYGFLYYSGAGDIDTNALVGGSFLVASNANGASGGSGLSGTWRLMGNTATSNNAASTSLFTKVLP